jgi:prolyl oligopeptidase
VKTWAYPNTRRDESVVDEHGVADPYRWLEDPDSEETRAWVEEQNKLTFGFLEECDYRGKIHERLKEVYNYPKYSCPFKRGDRFYFFKNDGLQNQSVLYTQETLDAEPTVFMDPNTLSEDGTASLGTRAFSESGAYYAHGIQRSGSDWQTVYVKQVASGDNLPDKLEWVKFSSIAWTHDDKGFFYARYPPPPKIDSTEGGKAGSEVDTNLHQKVYYHKLGTSQEEDPLIFETPDEPTLIFGVEVTDDGRYLLLTHHKGTAPVNKLYYYDLARFEPAAGGDHGLSVVKLVDNWEAQYEYITNEGTLFWFKTNLKAPKNKLITIDLTRPDESEWKELVAESEDVLDYAICFDHDKLALGYIHHVQTVLYVHALVSGERLLSIPMPAPGTVQEISGKKKESYLFYYFVSFLYPGTIFLYDRTSKHGTEPVPFREIQVPGFDASLFATEQVFYTSRDGTRVPMFVVSKRDTPRDGSAPVYLYGYGGFSISIQPSFSSFRMVLMQNLNVTVAIANIRGGGEYGEDWHTAGTLEKKQNVFDDFIGAAEWLVEYRYTSPARIVIVGGSNGGLLVGACTNQRPDLFGCAVAQVGVLDMLRFHKFTIGHAWTPDYGCADNDADFQYLIKYSPVHNVRPGTTYPAVLLTTGDHDDRVVPLHSYKYISALQHTVGSYEEQVQPLMIRIETKAGHGGGKPTSKAIEEAADTYTFIARTLGLTWTD